MSNLRFPGIAAMALAVVVLSSFLFTESASAGDEPRPTEPRPTVVPGTSTVIIPKSWGKFIHRYDGNGALFFEDSSGTIRWVSVVRERDYATGTEEVVRINSGTEVIRK